MDVVILQQYDQCRQLGKALADNFGVEMQKKSLEEVAVRLDPPGRGRKQWHDLIPDRVADVFTVRKAIKDLLYGWPYFSTRNKEQVIADGLPSRKQMETCASQLGDLHDVIVQLSLLRDRSFLLCVCPHSATFLEAAELLWLQEEREENNPMAACNLNARSYELHVD